MFRPLMGVFLLSAFSVSASFAQGGVCQAFFDQQEFEAFNEGHGKFLKGIETFEESNIPPDNVAALANPLQGNVPNVDNRGFGFPNGLEEKNIVIQDNVTEGCSPPDPNPGDMGIDLAVIGVGYQGANSKKVSARFFTSSTDLIFPDETQNHTGVGFELGTPQKLPASPWHITVYATDGSEIGNFDVPLPPSPEPGKTFFGIWCELSIGRINICDSGVAGGEFVDNIQMWEELSTAVEPGTWGSIKSIYR